MAHPSTNSAPASSDSTGTGGPDQGGSLLLLSYHVENWISALPSSASCKPPRPAIGQLPGQDRPMSGLPRRCKQIRYQDLTNTSHTRIMHWQGYLPQDNPGRELTNSE